MMTVSSRAFPCTLTISIWSVFKEIFISESVYISNDNKWTTSSTQSQEKENDISKKKL